MCAQQAPAAAETDESAYWTERLHWMRDAGVGYWKIDWGKRSRDAGWRQMIAELGAREAPNRTRCSSGSTTCPGTTA